MTIEDKDLQGMLIASPPHDDLKSTLSVNPNNRMTGQFQIIALGDSERDATMHVRAVDEDDLTATLSVRVEEDKDLDSSIEIKYRDNSYLSGTFLPMVSDYLNATIEVKPNGRMFGIFEIIEPPRITDELIPVKDATTRSKEEYKYMNYGFTPTMMVGNNDEEILKSFIQFDLSQYPTSLVVEEAKIRLYYTGVFSNVDTLELWTADREWTEGSITEANRPLTSSMISNSYTINRTDKYIEFDVFDYVVDMITDEDSVNYGLMIKSNDDTNLLTDSLLTKESSKPPYLSVRYFDTRVQSVGEGVLEATLLAYGTGREDLSSYFVVKTDYDLREIEGTMFVHRYDTPVHTDYKAYLNVSIPEINSTVLITKTGDSDLNSKFTVAKWDLEDYPAFVNINSPELMSTMYVRHTDDREATMYTRAFGDNLIESKIIINNPELLSYMTARAYDTKDLTGHLYAIGHRKEYVESFISISKPDLDATLLARMYDHTYLNSYMTVRQSEWKELDSFLHVNQPELSATMMSKIVSYNDATIIINKPEISAILYPRAIEEYDFDGFLYPRVIEPSDLNSYIMVFNKYRSGSYYYIL